MDLLNSEERFTETDKFTFQVSSLSRGTSRCFTKNRVCWLRVLRCWRIRCPCLHWSRVHSTACHRKTPNPSNLCLLNCLKRMSREKSAAYLHGIFTLRLLCSLSLKHGQTNDSTCMIKLISCLSVCLSHIQTLEFFSICKILLISKFRNSTSIYFRVTLMFQYHHRAIDKVRKINKRGITGARI